MNAKPFLKWAGGKRWFVESHTSLLPTEYNRYVEPFLGGGAVFFHLKPKRALLGDINSELIETYSALKTNWKLVVRYLGVHQKNHGKRYYYQVRDSIPRGIYARAARFIYLNRTCWNGLYRVNREGLFNVPKGDRSSVISPDDSFEGVSQLLKNAELYSGDFEYLIGKADRGDLLFIDPPYTVRHNNNAFVKYNETLFSWDDQERLSDCLRDARNRGAIIVATNAYHRSVKNLYREHFSIRRVDRNSSISSNVDSRKRYDELVILSEI